MNKRELIARTQRHMGAGASREAARAAVNAVLESILHTAGGDGHAHLAQLGRFEYHRHQARNGKGLPQTNTQPPHTTLRLRFRPAASLRQRAAHSSPTSP